MIFTQRKYCLRLLNCVITMDEATTPVMPRTEASWKRGGGTVGRSGVLPIGGDIGLGMSQGFASISGFAGNNVHTSTPNADVTAIHQLTDMVGQLGAQIGESIVAKLMSAGVVNLSSDTQTQNPARSTSCDVTTCDSPHVTVHVAPDKDLQTFKGDGTDKLSVQDWIDMTKLYLKKRGIPIHEQAEEIMGHLLGKARDVVRIALRGNPDLSVAEKPSVVYDILLRYFSDVSSCLPLADFYATLPKAKENPVDYWIRLNKAADRAQEGLRRQGNAESTLTNEVALMFVKHCPDSDLSSTFKWKPIHQWTTKDVQSRIDDYQREMRANPNASYTTQLKVQTTAVAPEDAVTQTVSVQAPEPCSAVNPHLSLRTTNQASVPVLAQNLQQSDERLLRRMVDMFQEVMDKMQTRNPSPAANNGPFRTRQRRPRESSCRVCSDTGHSTVSHCRTEKLCFACLAPGHVKSRCPNVTSESPPSQGQGN